MGCSGDVVRSNAGRRVKLVFKGDAIVRTGVLHLVKPSGRGQRWTRLTADDGKLPASFKFRTTDLIDFEVLDRAA